MNETSLCGCCLEVELGPEDDWHLVPDQDGNPMIVCGDCYTSRAYLDRAGDEAEVRY